MAGMLLRRAVKLAAAQADFPAGRLSPHPRAGCSRGSAVMTMLGQRPV